MILIKNNLLLGRLLLDSTALFSQIELEIKKDLSKIDLKDKIDFHFGNSSMLSTFKNNFFTLLMLSLLMESKISKKNLLSYGKTIIYLRQIITSVDNIIDRENKGVFFLKTLDNTIVKNSFIGFLCQNFITKECGEHSEKLLNEMHEIALSESFRDLESYKIYPSPEFIRDSIHGGIGGKLLEISLFIPLNIENNPILSNFSKGLYLIGIALQEIDDLFDVDEDMENNKANLATSIFLQEKSQLHNFKSLDKIELTEEFKINYLKKSLKTAYSGFSILEENGYPLTKRTTKIIMKKLFIMRGLKKYSYLIKKEF